MAKGDLCVQEELDIMNRVLAEAEEQVRVAKRNINNYFMPIIKVLDPSYEKAGAEVVSFEADPRFGTVKVVTSWNNSAGSFTETVLISKDLLQADDPVQAARDHMAAREAFTLSLASKNNRDSFR